MLDTKTKGCYVKAKPVIIPDQQLAILLIESALHAIPEGKSTFSTLLNLPAMFPFQLPDLAGDLISTNNPRLEILNSASFDDKLIRLHVYKVPIE